MPGVGGKLLGIGLFTHFLGHVLFDFVRKKKNKS